VQTATHKPDDEKARKQQDENKKRFPLADFNEPEPSDPQKREAQHKTKVRHNKFGLVDRDPSPNSGGGAFLPERQFDFPAMPIQKSDVIVLGEVIDAQAHLSEDKSNVYSEFTIRIEVVFKSSKALERNSQITAERIGGYVKYPDGRKLLYFVGSAGMPLADAKYVLFLNTIKQSDNFTILTGYEVRAQGISPLDSSDQFEVYRGYDQSSFLTELSNLLTNTQHHK
jgi:hypothetical protein